MKINTAVIGSWAKKIVPVVVTYLVSKGVIDDALGQQVPQIVDALIIVISAIPTIISSVRTHGK